MSRILILYGGWQGHNPSQMTEFLIENFLQNHDIIKSDKLSCINPELLKDIDLLIPIWTYGELTQSQEITLDEAIRNGMGIIALHGLASAFQSSRLFKFIIGGQFVAHPDGSDSCYEVYFTKDDPIVKDLKNFTIKTEQYYLLVDPAVHVLATTIFKDKSMDWINNVTMPVSWKRKWDKGNVFYCSLGHTTNELTNPAIKLLLERAIKWAIKKPEHEKA